VRKTLREVGFVSEETGIDCDNCQVIVNVQQQSSEIANCVFDNNQSIDDLGAGDQGLMFGYATDEWDTETLHPYSHLLAN